MNTTTMSAMSAVVGSPVAGRLAAHGRLATLRETAPGVNVDAVMSATAAPLIVDGHVGEMLATV